MGSKMKIRSAVIEWQRRLDGLNVPILILGLMVSLWLLRGFPPPIAWELFCAQWEYVLSLLEVRSSLALYGDRNISPAKGNLKEKLKMPETLSCSHNILGEK